MTTCSSAASGKSLARIKSIESLSIQVVRYPEPGLAKRVEFLPNVDVPVAGTAKEDADRAGNGHIVASGRLACLALVEEYQVGVRLDRVGERGGLTDVQFPPELDVELGFSHCLDLQHATIAELFDGLDAVLASHQLFLHPLGCHHSLELPFDEV